MQSAKKKKLKLNLLPAFALGGNLPFQEYSNMISTVPKGPTMSKPNVGGLVRNPAYAPGNNQLEYLSADTGVSVPFSVFTGDLDSNVLGRLARYQDYKKNDVLLKNSLTKDRKFKDINYQDVYDDGAKKSKLQSSTITDKLNTSLAIVAPQYALGGDLPFEESGAGNSYTPTKADYASTMSVGDLGTVNNPALAAGIGIAGSFATAGGQAINKNAANGVNKWGTALSDAGTGATLGATIGSAVPGVGTVIGGAVGAGAGAVEGFIRGAINESKAKKAKSKADSYQRVLDADTAIKQSALGYQFAMGGDLGVLPKTGQGRRMPLQQATIDRYNREHPGENTYNVYEPPKPIDRGLSREDLFRYKAMIENNGKIPIANLKVKHPVNFQIGSMPSNVSQCVSGPCEKQRRENAGHTEIRTNPAFLKWKAPQKEFGGDINDVRIAPQSSNKAVTNIYKSGGSHEQNPNGGINIDSNGGNSSTSDQQAVASAEEGEVSWKDPISGKVYIFSRRIKMRK